MDNEISTNQLSIETYRSRWRRVKKEFGLDDPSSNNFSTGGLSRFVAEPSVRLVILPSDPEGLFIDFDEEFWTWWLAGRPNPADGQQYHWSGEFPTSGAAVRYAGTKRDMTSYLALHRNGGLELELGQGGAISARDGMRYFRLTYSIGQMWSALALYQEAIDRFSLPGPWEVSCALRKTAGAVLSNFGEGWAEPGQGFLSENQAVTEPNLLFRRELQEWPNSDGVKSLAFNFGGWIEDAWGYRQRRFLALRGSLSGQFDTVAYKRYR